MKVGWDEQITWSDGEMWTRQREGVWVSVGGCVGGVE